MGLQRRARPRRRPASAFPPGGGSARRGGAAIPPRTVSPVDDERPAAAPRSPAADDPHKRPAVCRDPAATPSPQVADDGRACVVLANKWDIYEGKDEASTRDVEKRIKETLSSVSWAEVVFTSAETGQRCLKVYDAVRRAVESHRQRIATATLNDVVRDAMMWQPPPATAAGKNAGKIYFVSQTATRPPTVVCMCNDPKAFTQNYRRYLTRKLRESIPFTGTPVNFVFRAKRQRTEEQDSRKRR